MNSEVRHRPIKVALVCEWLITFAGSEKVAEAILSVFPEADVYAVVDFLPEEITYPDTTAIWEKERSSVLC